MKTSKINQTKNVGLLVGLFFASAIGFAQDVVPTTEILKQKEFKGHVTLLKREMKPTTTVFIEGGSSIPSSDLKSNGYSNGSNFNAGVFVPLKGIFGVTSSVGYSAVNQQIATPDFSNIKYIDNGVETTLSSGGSSNGSKTKAMQVLVGPAVQLNFGKFSVIPSVMAGYQTVSTAGFSQDGSYNIIDATGTNGKVTYGQYARQQSTSSGVVIQPNLKVGWNLTKNISAFTSINHSCGPTVSNSYATFTPEGTPNVKGNYEIQQLQNGTQTTTTTETKIQNTAVNFGIAYLWDLSKPKKIRAAQAQPSYSSTNPAPPVIVIDKVGPPKPSTTNPAPPVIEKSTVIEPNVNPENGKVQMQDMHTPWHKTATGTETEPGTTAGTVTPTTATAVGKTKHDTVKNTISNVRSTDATATETPATTTERAIRTQGTGATSVKSILPNGGQPETGTTAPATTTERAIRTKGTGATAARTVKIGRAHV